MSIIKPTCRWAQRNKIPAPVVYLTLDVKDVKDEKLEILEDKVVFSAKSGEKEYACEIPLHGKIDTEKSGVLKNDFKICITLAKKVEDGAEVEWWPRLCSDKLKRNWLKTDFDHWVDEDEEDELNASDAPAGMPDMSGMGGMPGMGGMGGMPGMGGMGGMPGMGGDGAGGFDMASMMQQMGGMGDGAGGMDLSKLQELMKDMPPMGAGEGDDEVVEEDSDDEMPPLEPTAKVVDEETPADAAPADAAI